MSMISGVPGSFPEVKPDEDDDTVGQMISVGCKDRKTRSMLITEKKNRWGYAPSYLASDGDGYEAEIQCGYADEPGSLWHEAF